MDVQVEASNLLEHIIAVPLSFARDLKKRLRLYSGFVVLRLAEHCVHGWMKTTTV